MGWGLGWAGLAAGRLTLTFTSTCFKDRVTVGVNQVGGCLSLEGEGRRGEEGGGEEGEKGERGRKADSDAGYVVVTHPLMSQIQGNRMHYIRVNQTTCM